MLEGKTRIPPVEVETRLDDLRETLTMIITWQNASSRFNRAVPRPIARFLEAMSERAPRIEDGCQRQL